MQQSIHIGQRDVLSYVSNTAIIAILGLVMASISLLPRPVKAAVADTISSSTYIDADGNGQVDHVKLAFGQNVTQCDYEAVDWSIGTAGDINITGITGIDTTDPEGTGEGACTGADSVVYVQITADVDITGGSIDPQISYQNTGTADSLKDSSGVISNKNSIVLADAAAPIVIDHDRESLYLDINSDGNVDRLVFTYSEAISWNGSDLDQFVVTSNDLTGLSGSPTSRSMIGDSVFILDFPVAGQSDGKTGVGSGGV